MDLPVRPPQVVKPEDVAEEQRRDIMRNQYVAQQQREAMLDLMERQRNRELLAWALLACLGAWVLHDKAKRSRAFLHAVEG